MFCLIQCLTFTGLCKVLSLCLPFIGLCKVLTESMSYIHWPVQCSIRFSVLHSLACAMFYQIQCLTFAGLCNVLSDSVSYIHWPVQYSIRFNILHSLACAMFSDSVSYIRWPVQSSPLAGDPAAPGAWRSSSAPAPALSAGRSTAVVSLARGGPPCPSCCQSACCPAHSTVLQAGL